ncbi:putative gustatory receptor 28a isoform X2 [Tenebrio molitor]|uniref:putative gustatory receptor 28a isoform X2 n=1 Tax=Tenebrio molitor TaxID=7067 RepID=UPI0036249086
MTKRNIFDSASITIYTSLLIGLFPIYVDKSGRRVVAKTNKYCTVVICIYLAFFTLMLYLGSLETNPVIAGKMYNFNTLAKLLILVVTLVGVLAMYVVFLLSYSFKPLFRDFFNTIATIDKSLAKFGHRFNYKTEFLENVLVTVAGPIFILSNLAMELWNIPREKITPIPPVLLFCHLFPFVLIHHGESQFFLTNRILQRRFAVVNLILEKLNERFVLRGKYCNQQKKIVLRDLIKNEKTDERILDFCVQSHDKLCDMCDIVNKLYGFPLIIGCLIQFNTIVFAFCYCYFSLSIRPISTLGWFLWSILRIYELARKSISAHIRASEVSRHINLQTIPKPDTIPDSRNFPMDQQTAHSLQHPRRRKVENLLSSAETQKRLLHRARTVSHGRFLRFHCDRSRNDLHHDHLPVPSQQTGMLLKDLFGTKRKLFV